MSLMPLPWLLFPAICRRWKQPLFTFVALAFQLKLGIGSGTSTRGIRDFPDPARAGGAHAWAGQKVDSCSKFDFLEKSKGEQEFKPAALNGKAAVSVFTEIQEAVLISKFNRYLLVSDSRPSHSLEVNGFQPGHRLDDNIILFVLDPALKNPASLRAKNDKDLDFGDRNLKMGQERNRQALQMIIGVVAIDSRKLG
jgi:hypothetical protein